MKILYVLYALAGHGGLERIIIDKMNYLSDIYHYDVNVVTMSQRSMPIPYKFSSNVSMEDLNISSHSKYKLHFVKRLYAEYNYNRIIQKRLQDLIDRISPDIIVCTTYWGMDIVSKLQFSGKRIVESHVPLGHLFDYDDKNTLHKLRWLPYLKSARKYDMLVALTTGDAIRWRKFSDKITIIPNTVPNDHHSLCSSNSHKIIAVGRLFKEKGFDLLIEAWSIIEKQFPDWHLDIFGEGELHEQLENEIKGHRLNNIYLKGVSNNIFQEYCQSSIFVLSSRFEGFSLVLVEAMSCGLPCVSFACPYGPPDIINHGKNGLLVEPENIQDLAGKILYLIENEEVRKSMGSEAVKSSLKYYPAKIMPKWKELFESI